MVNADAQNHPYRKDVSYQLIQEEQEKLVALIRAARFFSLPEKPTSPRMYPMDAGRSLLTLWDGARNRTLDPIGYPELDELGKYIGLLSSHAEVVHEIELGGGCSAAGALNPKPHWPFIIQPQTFKDPLLRLLEGSPHGSNLVCILEALLWLTDRQEWAKLLAHRLRSAGREKRFEYLQYLVRFRINIPSHSTESTIPIGELLTPEVLKYFEIYSGDMGTLTKKEWEILLEMADSLAERRHEPATPLMIRLLMRSGPRDDTFHLSLALMKMGSSAIRGLRAPLASPKAHVRQAACEILEGALRMDGEDFERQCTPPSERESILKFARSQLTSELSQMRKADPSEMVRKHAADALASIDFGYANECRAD